MMKIRKSAFMYGATIQIEDGRSVTLKAVMPSCGETKPKRTGIPKVVTRCRGM
jgi:hypothetical protein